MTFGIDIMSFIDCDYFSRRIYSKHSIKLPLIHPLLWLDYSFFLDRHHFLLFPFPNRLLKTSSINFRIISIFDTKIPSHDILPPKCPMEERDIRNNKLIIAMNEGHAGKSRRITSLKRSLGDFHLLYKQSHIVTYSQ